MKIRGTWRCALCRAVGSGGRDAFESHYRDQHYIANHLTSGAKP